MKFGRQLEEAIVEFITNNQGRPGHGLESQEITSFFANAPGEYRIVEQALARLVKKGELVEDRGREPNGIATYLLPAEVVRLDNLVMLPASLVIDPAYQRKLESSFDMLLADKITVTEQPNGSMLVIDGHHRVAAAKALGFETLPYNTSILVQKQCPNGHGSMTLYQNAPGDDEDDFFECAACGHKEHVEGQRSGDDYDDEEAS